MTEPWGPPSADRDDVAAARARLIELGAERDELDVPDIDLPGVALNVLLRSDATLNARELADRTGVTVEHCVQMYRELGITIDDVDEVRFREEEVPLGGLLRAAVVDLFTAQEGHELVVVMARSLAGIADASVAGYVQTVEARLLEGGGSLVDWTEANAEVTGMARQLGDALGPLFIHYLRQAVEHQRIAQQGVSSRSVMRLAVGFVDLVGFTQMSEAMPPDELSEMMGRFESQAFDLANEHRARVVKHIGDEIMFSAVDAADACRMAKALRDDVGSDTRPRGGVAFGEVISRHGDFYGPVVNLASRLTDEAVPGEVLVAEEVRDNAEGLVFEPAGRRQLKGFTDPVTVLSLC